MLCEGDTVSKYRNVQAVGSRCHKNRLCQVVLYIITGFQLLNNLRIGQIWTQTGGGFGIDQSVQNTIACIESSTSLKREHEID